MACAALFDHNLDRCARKILGGGGGGGGGWLQATQNHLPKKWSPLHHWFYIARNLQNQLVPVVGLLGVMIAGTPLKPNRSPLFIIISKNTNFALLSPLVCRSLLLVIYCTAFPETFASTAQPS
uniref:Uncharacterized protein n=1 Tax=Sphaerodactylus townsendi TaxID=933632 RepID=A0ACB8END0_9SAUR